MPLQEVAALLSCVRNATAHVHSSSDHIVSPYNWLQQIHVCDLGYDVADTCFKALSKAPETPVLMHSLPRPQLG
jgi:hypothetical protein